MLLLLAVAVSTAINIPVGQMSVMASPAHHQSMAHQGTDDPCCPDQTNHGQDGICATAGNCSLWMSASLTTSFLQPDGEAVQAEPVTDHSGAVPFPHFHPPKLSARV